MSWKNNIHKFVGKNSILVRKNMIKYLPSQRVQQYTVCTKPYPCRCYLRKYKIYYDITCLKKTVASSAYCVNSWILSDTSVYEYLFIDLWICVFVFSTISIYSRVIVWCTSRIPGYRCGKVLYSHQCALYFFTSIEKDLSFSFVVAIQEFDVLRYLFSIRPIFFPFILICIIRAFLT